jgi:hypothetical protein
MSSRNYNLYVEGTMGKKGRKITPKDPGFGWVWECPKMGAQKKAGP